MIYLVLPGVEQLLNIIVVAEPCLVLAREADAWVRTSATREADAYGRVLALTRSCVGLQQYASLGTSSDSSETAKKKKRRRARVHFVASSRLARSDCTNRQTDKTQVSGMD